MTLIGNNRPVPSLPSLQVGVVQMGGAFSRSQALCEFLCPCYSHAVVCKTHPFLGFLLYSPFIWNKHVLCIRAGPVLCVTASCKVRSSCSGQGHGQDPAGVLGPQLLLGPYHQSLWVLPTSDMILPQPQVWSLQRSQRARPCGTWLKSPSGYSQNSTLSSICPTAVMVQAMTTSHLDFCRNFLTGLPAFTLAPLVCSQHHSQKGG